jgi:uncharacterized membrane protein
MGGWGRALLALGVILGAGLLAGGCGGNDESTPTFCDVEPVLEEHCFRCHSDPPKEGAPFPLTSAARFQTDFFGQKVYEVAEDAIAMKYMPPSEGFEPAPTPLSAADRERLLEFLEAGAPDCK